ncbi:HAD family phosphatase [Granulosicoccus sp.]|nr:HAD family phosphatase [Granulosicoccus sp.]MDB4224126.1 HAD family phosphatase [Granulosicoccus sp.]
MLTTLVLDIGNVICDWNPDGLVATAFDTEADREAALDVTVRNPDWLALDRGAISVAEATQRAQARTTLDPVGIAKIYTNLCTSLEGLPESMAAMHRAKELDIPIYILSNMQTHAWEYLAKTYDCWDACEGVLVSCDVGLIKPDPAIYQCICDTFKLTASECVFVDDMAENIEAAIEFGMQGVQLTDKHAGGTVIDSLIDQIVAAR